MSEKDMAKFVAGVIDNTDDHEAVAISERDLPEWEYVVVYRRFESDGDTTLEFSGRVHILSDRAGWDSSRWGSVMVRYADPQFAEKLMKAVRGSKCRLSSRYDGIWNARYEDTYGFTPCDGD